MVARKKIRKVSVTKKDIAKIREFNDISSYKAKKNIVSGPWTDIKTEVQVKAVLQKSSGAMTEILGPAYGNYTKEELAGEKGWYSIVFNVASRGMHKIIAKHGVDEFVAACEKSLTAQTKGGKSKYGTVVIVSAATNNVAEKGFVSCKAKTNKKSISGFRALRKKEYVVL